MTRNASGAGAIKALATIVLSGLLAVFLGFAPTPAAAQEGPYFELLDPPVFDDPKNWGGIWTVDNGQVTQNLYDGRYVSSHGWSLPAASDATGFDLNLHVSGAVICGPMSIGTGVSSTDFTFADDVHSVDAYTISEGQAPDCPQATIKNSGVIHVFPAAGTYAVGDKLELYVGASYGPGVRYTFTVTRAGTSDGKGGATTAGDDGDDDNTTGSDYGSLQAILDCPDSIVIGKHPGLQCAIEISGYKRNTSAPVVVTSPSEVDGYGNTMSGIQLSVLTGAADPSNWDVSYHWPFSPFACAPGSPGSGANCYDNFTTPGEKKIPIIVSQDGVGQVTLIWTVRADAGAVKGSVFDGKWMTSFGEMLIAVNGADASGTYAYSGGQVFGTVEGPVFFGIWVQAGGAGRECDSEFRGSKSWGRFVFTLAPDGKSFTGVWGYCNDEPTRTAWDGARP